MTNSGADPQMVSNSSGVFNKVPLIAAIVAVIGILITFGMAYGVHNVAAVSISEGRMVNGVREFELKAQQWEFEPRAIKVNRGENIMLTLQSEDITHGFAINELGINMDLPPGEKITRRVTIPADISEGTYAMYCTVFCGIGHPYMKAHLIIGEAGGGMTKYLPFASAALVVVVFGGFTAVARRWIR
ncbi:MAG: cupredoxin domain-containing protein [Chloroflexota bacterium]